MYRFTLSLVAAFFSSAYLFAAEPIACRLTENGTALRNIVISPEASPEIRSLADEFSQYLFAISGAHFEVVSGDGSRGIVLGRSKDFFALPFDLSFQETAFTREHYLLRSRTDGLYLLGATDLAVSHAVWDLLHRFGYRQFFPGETWEIVPHEPNLAVAVDELEKPAFYARRIWYEWGARYGNEEPYQQWCRRNRAVQGFELNSGHAYESIIDANREEFDRHPEYFALLDGSRKTTGGDLKFCIANPNLRKLVVGHALRHFHDNPELDSISMDPSDGGGWCQCENCVKLGRPSNRVVLLAGEVAEAINKPAWGEKIVGFYAYNEHSTPPTVAVPKQTIPSVTTAFLHGGLGFEEIAAGWKSRGADRWGVYDYLSVVAWDWNMPREGKASKLKHLQEFLPRIHQMGARFYDAQTDDSWGPSGLGHYFVSRVLWDPAQAERLDEMIEDFLQKAFGEAAEPMKEFYRLITTDTTRRPLSDLVGRMYRQLEAARLCATDAAVRKRLDDLVLYTRYVELYGAFADGSGSHEDVLRHAYRIRKTMMVHSYAIWCTLLDQEAAERDGHPLKIDIPFTPEEIDKIVADGIAGNLPMEPGFESVAFSRDLVPAAEALNLPEVPLGGFPPEAQDHQRYHVWIPEGENAINLKMTVQKVWETRSPKVSLHSPLDVTITAVAEDESYRPDGKEYAIRLKTPYSGLHRLETFDGGDFTRIVWPSGFPVCIESGIDTPDVDSHFRGNWTLYCYVPKGTKQVGGWASRVASWAPRIGGKLLDPSGNVLIDFDKQEEGWFLVDVPEGADGKLWKFENNNGTRLLMTIPPFLARNGEELLLPKEVVDRDRL